MPDEVHEAAPVSQTVNVQGGGILDGLSGTWKQVVAMGFAGVVAYSFLYLQYQSNVIAREDRLHDREVFERTVRQIQDEDNRRTGEIKGAMDKNTEVMRDLIAEIRAARHGGQLQERGALPKAIKPPEEKQP